MITRTEYHSPSDILKYTVRGPGGCQIWQRGKSGDGYGAVWIDGKTVRAHRLMCTMLHGPIPPGFVVMHTCDTRDCVNPEHLRIGTDLENIADRQAKNRQARGANSGRRLHPERYANAARFGVSNPAAKITEATAQAIRDSALTYQRTADKFGVSKTLVAKISRREIWQHRAHGTEQ